ncbi:histidine--tRNA ligase [Candidatus Desantisbacteria bacterium CG2_30_40_21]|uniref:Histidine--tRNA ligase n=4 Tax=unclassified Candidatus Desantisiibacteriota TaxID=3106372 RepID=A0A2M7JEF8_9BACT|nr:MAG: histidine--tRNA ligase [Candidatus Desantisbacteria bacterium CG2_30_40_21]PIP41517.1 MAG: histidine--tRNA ligase [Candidatus Desantisbacteria bacterium CG23_combo_of_CG06-09_8_20_14_all_40_23]PIX17780.1 MAG: histidine--tRNA ligase [Candidatus Desantisbacteria bacterium CG_4_8_14_3_um_filter_40_12]PIY20065.1 MAG: histidine--tRNA ligase [Candidatus Desantisbacteria bacterium CG_4_10_14_3_um_filter_40_18]
MGIKAPRGTVDILPQDMEKWHFIEDIARQTISCYGYQEIRTPIFEATELFVRGIGDSTDIVNKEMYTFQDKKGRSITLRPENTAAVVRAYLEHNLGIQQGSLIKLFYMGPMFRYERPQAGRQRQFYQFGTEAIGSVHPGLDAEVIAMALQIFEQVGIVGLKAELNSVGCNECRTSYHAVLLEYFRNHISQMCPDCQMRLEKNPMRILDCKAKTCQIYISQCPTVIDSVCPACRNHLDEVIKYLQLMGISPILNPRLVRGLDYYTKTAFEIRDESLGAQNAVAAGGRYDNLVRDMGGPATPAIGFAAGMERIILAMKNKDIEPIGKQNMVYIAVTSEEVRDKSAALAQRLRADNIPVELSWDKKSLKSQFRHAANMNARYTIIVGDSEINQGKVMLKDMTKEEQQLIAVEELSAWFKSG